MKPDLRDWLYLLYVDSLSNANETNNYLDLLRGSYYLFGSAMVEVLFPRSWCRRFESRQGWQTLPDGNPYSVSIGDLWEPINDPL